MPVDHQIEILEDLLKTAERNFDDTVKSASLVADNAQKTSGLAGLFLAAAFGFVKPESLTALRDQYGMSALWLLYSALALFVFTVLLCLWATWFKDIPSVGLSLESQETSAEFLLQLPPDDLDAEIMAAYIRNKIEIWKTTTAQRSTVNTTRARIVHWAQRTLAGGILVSAMSLGLLGYATRNTLPLKQVTPMQKSIAPEKKPAGAPKRSESESGKTPQMSRETVLRKLQDKEFIADQVRQIPRTRLG